jgi:CRP/FNR family transcriptional regulator
MSVRSEATRPERIGTEAAEHWLPGEPRGSSAAASESGARHLAGAGPAGGPEPCRSCASRRDCLMAVLARALPPDQNNHLFHSHVLHVGEHVFFAGDPLKFLRVVKSGSVKTYMTSKKGEEHVVTFLMPGDVLGVDALVGGEHESSAVALETTAICTAPLSRVEQLVGRFSPGWLLRLLAEEVRREQRTLMMRSKKSAESRLAAFLVNLSEGFRARGYSDRDFKLSMPRQDIGNYLGLTMETVSRTFTRMQCEGLLEVNRRRVIIRDFDNLSDVADMQPAIGHQAG